jgi:hypothetical protein
MYVYFIASEHSVKIGITREVKARLTELQIGNPHKLKVINTITKDTKEEARKTEKLFHTIFRKHRKHGEWFNLAVLKDIDFETETIIWGDGGLHFTAELSVGQFTVV